MQEPASPKGKSPLTVLAVILGVAVVVFGGLTYWQNRVSVGESAASKQKLAEAEAKAAEAEKKAGELEVQLAEKAKAEEEARQRAEELEKAKTEADKAAMEAALAVPDGWASFDLAKLDRTLRYPREWGKVKVTAIVGTAGDHDSLTFSAKNAASLWYKSVDFAYGDVDFVRPQPPKTPPTCEDVKKIQGFESIENCEVITLDERTMVFFRTPSFEDARGTMPAQDNGWLYTGNERYPVVEIVADVGGGVTLDSLKKVLWSVK